MSEARREFSLSMWVVSSGIFLSRVLGLVRDVVMANVWGTGVVMAAFTTAFTIPNLLRGIFGEGNFSAAFVPTFSETLEKEGRARAWEAACVVVSTMVAVLAVVVVVTVPLSLGLRWFVHKQEYAVTLQLLPWLMPYGLLICAGGALGMVLNSLRHFTVPALTPLLLNLFLVIAALLPFSWLYDLNGEKTAMVLVPAVLAAGVLHIYCHMWVLRRWGLRFHFCPNLKAPEVRKVMLLMAPAVLGTSVGQINIVVDRFLALYLGADAASSLYYSQRLIYLPVGLFGVASSTVALPVLSRAWARKDLPEMHDNLLHSLAQTLFLTLPVTVLLLVAGEPMIRLLFERGSFTAHSTHETFWALAFYLPGIPAMACVKIVASGFYAAQDTRTPVKIAVVCVATNLALNLILMQFLAQGGLALSTSVASCLNLGLLIVLLRRRAGINLQTPMLGRAGRMLLAALCAAACGGALRWAWPHLPLSGPALFVRGAEVGALGGVVYGGYALGAWLFRCREMTDAWGVILNKIRRRLGRRVDA